jgi:hypothetical protein
MSFRGTFLQLIYDSMRRSLQGILALAALVAACAIPTDAPNWDVIWNLPLPDSGQTIAVANFLPSGVTVAGTAPTQVFRAVVDTAPSISRSLGIQCPACPSATAQKDSFSAPLATDTISLTADSTLKSGTLAVSSQIALQVINGFTFDPIRPPGGNPGQVTFTVHNGIATLGVLTLSGTTSAIPASATSSFVVPLSGTFDLSSPITVTMTMDSPAGSAAQPVTMNANQLFRVNSTPTIDIAQATVTIASQVLSPTSTSQDLSSGPLGELETRIDTSSAGDQGSMFLQIANPLTVGANGTLTITGTKYDTLTDSPVAFTPVVKPLIIPSGGSSTPIVVRIDFTGKELQRIMGSNATFTITGTTGSGTTALTPTTEIQIFTRIQVRAFIRELK